MPDVIESREIRRWREILADPAETATAKQMAREALKVLTHGDPKPDRVPGEDDEG